MSENKEEILANFQSITGIDDVGEAFSHLEETDWDLMAAIQRVIPQDDELPQVPSEAERMLPMFTPFNGNNHTHTNDLTPMNNFSTMNTTNSLNNCNSRWPNSNHTFASTSHAAASTSTSNADTEIIDLTQDMDLDASSMSAVKTIVFDIHYNQQIYNIKLPFNATVEKLKQKIRDVTNVPTCRQALSGWPPAHISDAQKSNSLLSNLGLTSENQLVLIDLTEQGFVDYENDDTAARVDKNFKLTIVEQPSGKQLELSMPGHTTVEEVKMNVFYISDIPMRHQEWTGWPNGVDSQTTLAQSGIELSHNFILYNSAEKSKSAAKASSSNERASNTTANDTDSSDEFEDASDFNACEEYFTDSPTVQTSANRHLIPNNTDDEIMGSIQFSQNYTQRFGEPHPVFYTGSLESALKEACHKPARERKLLAIYLHHGESILTNVFCDHLMKHESIMQTLAQNFILYGWDFTHEYNKHLFLSSVTACVGNTASLTARNIPLDKLPALMIIGKSRLLGRTSCEVLSVIHGNVGLDDLLSRLLEAVEMYNEHLQVEVREEDERALREHVKAEQDMAYQETLEADMAKEAAKQQQEAAKAAERQRLESERAEEEARREAIRSVAEQALPLEPAAMDKEITKLRVRKPTGEFLERLFYQQNTLQDVLNYITANGFLVEEYKLISSWPRRDLTAMDPNETLHSLKLYPQETLILEER